jgi:4-amino-4-deoxy-L-arabinose transferase-like glycosyltransferase
VGRGGTILALAGIALIAFALRAQGTDVRTLWWDEAYHLRLAQLPDVSQMLGAILANPPSDPLFALLMRGWIGLTGTSDALMRAPSVLAGVGTAVATAWLGVEMTRSRLVALVAALLVAVAPYAVEFGQEMTLYTFATLWVTLALAAGWRWLRSGRRSDAAIAVVLAIVAAYSHYVAPPILGLALLVAASPWGGPRHVSRRNLVVGGLIVLVAWLPWALPMVASWLGSPDARTALERPATLLELAGAASQYTSGSGALLQGVRALQALGIAAAGILLARAWLIGRDPGLRGLRVVMVTAAVAFVVPWLVSAVTGRWLFVPHLLLPILPAVAVAAVAGGLLERGRLAMNVAAGALVGLFAVQLGGLYVNAQQPPHGADGVRDLAAIVNAEAAPGETAFVSPADIQLVVDHYLRIPAHGLPADVDLERLYVPFDADAALPTSLRVFDTLTAGATRAWLVYRSERDEGDRLLTTLRERGTMTLRGTFDFASLYEIELR